MLSLSCCSGICEQRAGSECVRAQLAGTAVCASGARRLRPAAAETAASVRSTGRVRCGAGASAGVAHACATCGGSARADARVRVRDAPSHFRVWVR